MKVKVKTIKKNFRIPQPGELFLYNGRVFLCAKNEIIKQIYDYSCGIDMSDGSYKVFRKNEMEKMIIVEPEGGQLTVVRK